MGRSDESKKASARNGMDVRTAVVTGASGFIGARVVQRLLERGVRVFALGRAKDGVSWPVRLTAALDDIRGIPVDRRLLTDLHAVEAILDQGALRWEALESAAAGSVVLYHLAGDTRFTPVATPSQRAVNVDAGPGMIEALGDALARVIHVSTADVAGGREGLVLESEFDVGQSFRNGYESTKLAGELRMRATCAARGLPLVIARPSIVINDTATGRSSAFTHLNALVEIVRRLQGHFELPFGETVSDRVRTPLRPDGRPNLIPVDVVVEALLAIADAPGAPGRAYHVCHPRPPALHEVIALLLQALAIEDRVRIEYAAELDETASWTEKMIARAFKPYFAYLDARASFDLANTRSLLPDYDGWFPPLGVEYLERVVAVHRAKGWSHNGDPA